MVDFLFAELVLLQFCMALVHLPCALLCCRNVIAEFKVHKVFVGLSVMLGSHELVLYESRLLASALKTERRLHALGAGIFAKRSKREPGTTGDTLRQILRGEHRREVQADGGQAGGAVANIALDVHSLAGLACFGDVSALFFCQYDS